MKLETYPVGLVAAAALAILAPAFAANPGGSGTPGKNPAVTLQPMPGTPAKRVILTRKAAERLGIETGKVSEQPIARKLVVGGVVVAPTGRDEPKPGARDFGQTAPAPSAKAAATDTAPASRAAPAPMASGGFAGFVGGGGSAPQSTLATAVPVARTTAKDAPPIAAPAASSPLKEAWILVTLSPGEWERLAKDKPVRVLPLATREKPASEIQAKPTAMQPEEDSRRSMLKLYYVVSGRDHGLELNKRMRVEVQLEGSNETHKVVPYSAVHYDAKGAPWVYVLTQPLTYERQRVTVDRIAGDFAVLSAGPPLGTPVVVTGAPLLYGAEVFGK